MQNQYCPDLYAHRLWHFNILISKAFYANNGNLKDLLDYHILNNDDNKYADLTRFTTVKTREGDDLTISNVNGMTINGAKVLSSKAYDHGVVYVIDKVLIPTKAANQLAKDMNKEPQSSICRSPSLPPKIMPLQPFLPAL